MRAFHSCRAVRFVIACLGGAAIAPSTARAAIQYNVVNLGSLGGGGTVALAINNNGQIVGSSKTAGFATHPFLYSNGSISDLIPTSVSGTAYGLNDNGQIVGGAVFAGGSATHPFSYSGGSATDLSTQAAFASHASGVAMGVNVHGVIVGALDVAAPTLKSGNPFVYDGSTLTIPPAIGFAQGHASGFATAVDDGGAVAGTTSNGFAFTGNRDRAFGYAGSTLTDLGGLSPDIDSYGNAINSSGVIAGAKWLTNTGPDEEAAIWNGSTITLLPPLASFTGIRNIANGINDSGIVVGAGNLTVGNPNRAFIYNGANTIDLNSLIDPAAGWVLTTASDINNQGVIIGNGTVNGQPAAFELVPVSVPEPACVGAVGIAIVVLSRGRPARRKA